MARKSKKVIETDSKISSEECTCVSPNDTFKSTENFEKIVIGLINLANELKEYDYFGAITILNVIQLMLSKSDDYVRLVQSGQPFKLEDLTRNQNNIEQLNTPKEIESEVDSVISQIKAKLEKEKD